MQIQQKLTPFIWYERGAEDAVAHYLKTFGTGHVVHTPRWARTRRARRAR
jgi:predicted 3-demethylubiquinone-9 3-methyltransferase (glyoxalase superfamily)